MQSSVTKMQQARDFFKQVGPTPVSAYYFQARGHSPISDLRAGCHMRILMSYSYQSNPDIEVFATNAKGTTPEEKRYLDWVMSRTESPWRKMFTDEYFELLHNNQGQQVGVLFPQSFLKKNKYVPIMGFVTALRLASEPGNHVSVWDDFVHKHGVHPVEALVLCSYFRRAGPDNYTFSPINTNHHTLNSSGGFIDVQKIKDGDLNSGSRSVFGLMPTGNVNLRTLYSKYGDGYKKQVGTLKGSVVHSWSIEEILKVWRSVYEG